MSWAVTAVAGAATVVGGVTSYLSSKDQADAAKDAAKQQRQGADRASEVQWDMYEQNREDLAPWREAGGRGLADLERVQGTYEGAVMDPNQYVQSPGYDWLREQGNKNINRQAAASGQFGSGRNQKDLMQYGQGLALTDYQGYLGRLESLMNRYSGTAQVGQTASNTLAGLGANAANQVGANSIYAGQAGGASQINQGNARTGLYQNLSNIGSSATNQFMLNNYLQNMNTQQPQSSGYPGAGTYGVEPGSQNWH